MSLLRRIGYILGLACLLATPESTAGAEQLVATTLTPVQGSGLDFWLNNLTVLASGRIAVAGNVVRDRLDLVITAPNGSPLLSVVAPGLMMFQSGLKPALASDFFLATTLSPQGGMGQQSDYLLQVGRIGEDGEVLWNRRFDRIDGGRIMLADLLPRADGGADVVVSVNGQALYGRSGEKGRNVEVGHVVRLDRGGNVVWTRRLDARAGEVTGAAAAPGDGLFVLAGDVVLELAADGGVRWAKRLQVTASNNVRLRGLTAVHGGVAVFGAVEQPDPAGADGLAISLNSEGELRWARTLDVGPDDSLASAVEGEGGVLVLAGSAVRMGASLDDRVPLGTGWLAGLDADGNLAWSWEFGAGGNAFFTSLAAHSGTVYALAALSELPQSRSVVFGNLAAIPDRACSSLRHMPTKVSTLPIDVRPVTVATEPAELKLSPAALHFQTSAYSATPACGSQ